MKRRTEIRQGTLAWMVLKTLDVLGPQHGFDIARRVKQMSGEQLANWHQTADNIVWFLAINGERAL